MKIVDIDPDKEYILCTNGRVMVALGETFIQLMKDTGIEESDLREYESN